MRSSTPISALVGNLTALRWPIGRVCAMRRHRKVMQLVDWANREKVRPSVTQCFDQMLDQNDAERFRPTAAPATLYRARPGGQLEQPGGDAGARQFDQVEDGNGRIQSRLDLVEDRFDDALVLLNKAVFKALHAANGARAAAEPRSPRHAAHAATSAAWRCRRGLLGVQREILTSEGGALRQDEIIAVRDAAVQGMTTVTRSCFWGTRDREALAIGIAGRCSFSFSASLSRLIAFRFDLHPAFGCALLIRFSAQYMRTV